MKITVLADNTVAARNARGEHGLAFSIETGENCLLFDTGQGFVLADNAQSLGVDLGTVDTIVLSHGHYDHTGGVAEVLSQATGPVAVHAHPDSVLPKYQRVETGARDIGIPAHCRDALFRERCQFAVSRRPVEVVHGVSTTGEIPRLHPEEVITEPFCRDLDGQEMDALLDDQALFIETAKGITVVLGCAHAGVINTLDHICTLTGDKSIRAVLGGMHLRSATTERMDWTIRELRRFHLDLLVPMHCTGQEPAAALWAAFPHACQPSGAGTLFDV